MAAAATYMRRFADLSQPIEKIVEAAENTASVSIENEKGFSERFMDAIKNPDYEAPNQASADLQYAAYQRHIERTFADRAFDREAIHPDSVANQASLDLLNAIRESQGLNPVTIQIQAIDAQSVKEFMQGAGGEEIRKHILAESYAGRQYIYQDGVR